jgi:phospholipid/cholesterol/gamma-HCH transport system substrate-binding protein
MDQPPSPAPDIRHAELKAAALLAVIAAIACGFVLYVLYARGTFESMDLTFSGFPVGRVQRIELAADGKARIEVDVPRKDAKWLRASSIFTLERSLVGGARLRAFTGDLSDKPLPDGAVRQVLRGDATDELPGLIATLKKLLENLEKMTAEDSSLNASLASVRTVTQRMTGPHGALGGLLGSEENAKKVIAALDRANALLATLDAVSARLDRALGRADESLFGAGGVVEETRNSAPRSSKRAKACARPTPSSPTRRRSAPARARRRRISPHCARKWRRACAGCRSSSRTSTGAGRLPATRK